MKNDNTMIKFLAAGENNVKNQNKVADYSSFKVVVRLYLCIYSRHFLLAYIALTVSL